MSDDLVARLRRHAETIKNDDCDAIMAGYHRPRAEATYRYEQQLAFEAAAAELVGLREQLARALDDRGIAEAGRAGAEAAARLNLRERNEAREQLARQAPVIEAAQHMCPAGHVPSNEAERELHDAIIAYRLNWPIEKARAVRALSVPAPPEAPERIVHLGVKDQEAIAEALLAAAPPTEEEAP